MKAPEFIHTSEFSEFTRRLVMNRFIVLLVLWSLCWSSSGFRMARNVCKDSVGYLYDNNCCLNCPAGTYVKEVCSRAFEQGVCEQCDFDFYTEHDNGLFKCLECSKCHPDQEIVEPCSSKRNTLCQCKPGFFCLPEQPCEVCKTCRKCKDDEVIVESCTPHSNTVCQKRGSFSATTSTVMVISILVAIVLMMLIISFFWYWRKSAEAVPKWIRGKWKMCIENGSDLGEVRNNNNNDGLEIGAHHQPFLDPTKTVGEETVDDEEDKGLGTSLPNTTASSQASLSVCAPQSEYCQSHSLLQQLNTLGNVRRVIPLNGDNSLRKCFYMFGDIDVTFHKRFFRILGLSDNAICVAEGRYCSPEDRVYELLKEWMEQEGMKADFNNLIQALLHLNQRLSAENIVKKAVDSCHFRYEED